MPFKSKSQAGYLHSHPEILGDKIHEWDAASKGLSLPAHALGHAPKKIREMHIKQGETKGYIIHKHHGDGSTPKEDTARNLKELHGHIRSHFNEEDSPAS